MIDDDKRIAAEAAVEEVRAGMIVGLGTGSTAAYAIRRIGDKVAAGLSIRCVPTSIRTAALARRFGIPLADPARVADIDLTIDGADEIDTQLRAIKGAGGAMLREKIVAAASRRMVVVADGSKRVSAIGRAVIPVEILPFGHASILAALSAIGARPMLRMNKGKPFRTDQNNLIADCAFGALSDPAATAAVLSKIPGALGHGLFLDQVDAAYVVADGRVTKMER